MTLGQTVILSLVVLLPLTQVVHATTQPLRATITGRAGQSGICTINVIVDGAAEIEVSGDSGVLKTRSGQPASWRRFECNRPLPSSPIEFRVVPVKGRGTVRHVQDPRTNRGTAVVRIDDPQRGSEGYILDLQWSEYSRDPGRFSAAQAISMCQRSVTDRLNRQGYRYVTFERTISDDRPGRKDRVMGTVTGNRGSGSMRFSFGCSVDFSSGRVRSVEVNRQ